MPPPRGTAQQCLEALPSGDSRLIGEISEFCGVNRDTAGRWLNGTNIPICPKLIALWNLLELSGCKVQEVQGLDPMIKDLGQLITFHLLEPMEMVSALGLTARTPSHLWEVLRGRHQLYPANYQRATDLVAAKRIELEKARHKAVRLSIPSQNSSSVPLVRRPRVVSVVRQEPAEFDTVEHLARLLGLMLPLAALVESDSFSDDDRKRLRELVGPEEYFRLTNLLHRLGGSEARQVYRRNG